MKKITLLAAFFISGATIAQTLEVVAGTSFEEEPIVEGVNDLQYVDTGDANVAHDLINNPLQTPVDQSGGTELGVDATYTPYDTPSDGLTDGDFVGVTNFTGTVGAFTDGVQGYQIQDSDGNMIVTFETVDLSDYINNSVSIDYFLQETGWEYSDGANNSGSDVIRIYVNDLTNATEIDILDTNAAGDIDDQGIEDMWITGTTDLPNNIDAQLVIEFRSNSSSEAMFIDNIIFQGEESLGAQDLTIEGFSMYPNPATSDVVNLVSASNLSKNVVVYDVLGQAVISTVVTNGRLNIGSLNSGIYLVQVTENNRTITKKLVVR